MADESGLSNDEVRDSESTDFRKSILNILQIIKNNQFYSTYEDISFSVSSTFSEISSWSHSFVKGQATRFYRTIFRSPGPIVLVMILLTFLVGPP